MTLRKDELDKVWFRTGRCFTVDDKWFFTTREGQNVGPFGSKVKAESGVRRYLESLQKNRTSGLYAAKLASDGLWASTGYN